MKQVGNRNRWILFAGLLVLLPFPLVGLEGLFVPTARFAQLAASLSILVLFEGAGGKVGAMLGLLWAHVFVYGTLLYVGTRVFEWLVLRRISERFGTWLVLGAVGLLVGWSLVATPYDSSFHEFEAHASSFRLYQ